MLPIFAAGIDFEFALPGGAAAGQSAFAVSDAPLFLGAGDLIFLSDADGAAPEFLGPAKTVESGTVVTSFPAANFRAPGALLWTPSLAFHFSVAPEPPIRRPVDTGVETLVTAGGSVVQTRVAEPVMREEVRFRGLLRSAFDALTQWLGEASEWGLRPFLYAAPDSRVWRVRLDGPPVPRAESAPGQFTVTLALLIID